MPDTCGLGAEKPGKGRVCEHKMCTAPAQTLWQHVGNEHFSPNLTTHFPRLFPLTFWVQLPLVQPYFSPLSTMPITTTTFK